MATGIDPRPAPRGNGNDARLKRWIVDNVENQAVYEDSPHGPVAMTGGELYTLLLEVAERFYRHGVDDVRERHGIR